jgi:hypothetical protein
MKIPPADLFWLYKPKRELAKSTVTPDEFKKETGTTPEIYCHEGVRGSLPDAARRVLRMHLHCKRIDRGNLRRNLRRNSLLSCIFNVPDVRGRGEPACPRV